MSRVNNTGPKGTAAAPAPPASAAVETSMAALPLAGSDESLFSDVGSTTSSALSEIHTKNIIVDTSMSATELSLGKTVKLSENLPAVFGVNASTPNIIVTNISLENVYSDVPQRVQVGCSLFDNAQLQHQHLKNEQGWLYAATSTELDTAEHSPLNNNFTNLVSILPFEQQRHTNISLYTPASSSLNSRMLQEYGGVQSRDQLMKGVVPVTPTTMYVPANSIICRVISRNWDRVSTDWLFLPPPPPACSCFLLTRYFPRTSPIYKFGFHPDQETKIESEFYRIDSEVVNR